MSAKLEKTATFRTDTSKNSRNSQENISNSSVAISNITYVNNRRETCTEMPEKVEMPTTVLTSAGTPTTQYSVRHAGDHFPCNGQRALLD
jgi:sensor c-di-GMP phosphodiesterase-like protein